MPSIVPPQAQTPAPAQSTTPLTGHPKGTLLLVGLYGLVFAAAWFAMYFLVYLRRGGVTP